MGTNDGKANARRSATSPENSSSPINFSSRMQAFNNNLSKSMEDFHVENVHRSRSMSNEEKSRDQLDDENVEVDWNK